MLLGFRLKVWLAALALLPAQAHGTAARVGAVLVGFGLLFLRLEMKTQALRGFPAF